MTFLHLFPPQSVEHILAIYLLMSIELFSGCLVSRHIFFLLLLLLRLSRHRFIHLLNISIVRNDDRVRHELNWVAKHPSLLPQTEPFLIRSSVIGRLIIQQMQRETLPIRQSTEKDGIGWQYCVQLRIWPTGMDMR